MNRGWELLAAIIGWIALVWVRVGDRLRRYLLPHHRFGVFDSPIERLNTFRSTLALVLVIFANLQWIEFSDLATSGITTWLTAIFTGAVTAGCMLLLGCVILLIVADPGSRKYLASLLWRPISTLLGALAVIAAFIAAFGLLVAIQQWATQGSGLIQILVMVVAVVALIVGLVAAAAGLVTGGSLAVTHYFRAVDGHPTLRAITALAVSLWVAGTGVVGLVTSGLDGRFPVAVSLALLFGGPAVMSALAMWELKRLRTLYSVRMTTVPVIR